MENYNKWINNYPEIRNLMTPIKNSNNVNFNKLDEDSCDHITNLILKKYGNNDSITENQTKYLMDEVYRILGKNKSNEEVEVNDFLNIHADGKNYLSKNDLNKSVLKYLGASKGVGININNNNKLSNFDKLKELAKEKNEDQEIERIAVEIYNKYNKDLNGYLDIAEIKSLMKDFYQDYNIKVDNFSNYFDNFFINLDMDINGKINFNEFCIYLKKIRDGKLSSEFDKLISRRITNY